MNQFIAQPVLHKELLKLITELPAVFQTPFQLSYEGYKYKEIAAILKEPLGTIKSKIHFARKLLKNSLQNHGYND